MFSDHNEIDLAINNKDNREIFEHLATNQHTSKNSMGYKRSLQGNNDIELNENTAWKLWDTAKVVQRVKFIAIKKYVRKEDNSQIDNLRKRLAKSTLANKAEIN